MTVEQDRADLARHEREIRDHQSFNYAILDADESHLLGCASSTRPSAGADADISGGSSTTRSEATSTCLADFVAQLAGVRLAVRDAAVHRARPQLAGVARAPEISDSP